MNRIQRLETQLKVLEDKLNEETKKKGFKMPGKVKRMLKKSIKIPDEVVILYLTQKYDMQFMLKKIIGGNCVVVGNKVHKLNPKKIWRWRKYTVYIVREIDREPVSNEDYDEVKRTGRDTEADVPLIKAVVGATQKPSPLANKKGIVIFIIIAIIAAIIGFSFLKGG